MYYPKSCNFYFCHGFNFETTKILHALKLIHIGPFHQCARIDLNKRSGPKPKTTHSVMKEKLIKKKLPQNYFKTNLYLFSDKWILRRNEEESLLPGLKYSQRQLFWVSAANVWCAKYRPKALKLRVLTGVHAPDMFRVRGPFSNMDEFARDFKCPIGSPMNRQEKCQVW